MWRTDDKMNLCVFASPPLSFSTTLPTEVPSRSHPSVFLAHEIRFHSFAQLGDGATTRKRLPSKESQFL